MKENPLGAPEKIAIGVALAGGIVAAIYYASNKTAATPTGVSGLGLVTTKSVRSGFVLSTQFTNGIIPSGSSLNAGQVLWSQNKQYYLTMQTDNNLVVYNAQNQAQWASNTRGSGAVKAAVQTDGNFVLYDKNNNAVWSSGSTLYYFTQNNEAYLLPVDPQPALVMQNDGNLVLYWKYVGNPNYAVWSSKTGLRFSTSGNDSAIIAMLALL
jgi:hypothetical protein